MTPSQIVAQNIRRYMKTAGLTQADLAGRLSDIGEGMSRTNDEDPGWHRATLGRLFSGERRISVNELFALALAVETTVAALLTPPDGAGEPDSFTVGKIPSSFDRSEYLTLLHRPEERVSKDELGLEGWSNTNEDRRRPQWTMRRSAIRRAIEGARGAFERDHPGRSLDDVPAFEVVDYLESLAEEGDSKE